MDSIQQPFFIRGVRRGFVDQVESRPGFKRGVLHLDECSERVLFSTVVSLARDVDTASSDGYQGSWEMWRRGCDELQGLVLRVGDEESQIDAFDIESDWSIEWSEGIEWS